MASHLADRHALAGVPPESVDIASPDADLDAEIGDPAGDETSFAIF